MEWEKLKQLTGVFDAAAEITKAIQGGDNCFIGHVTYLMNQLCTLMHGNTFEVRPDVYKEGDDSEYPEMALEELDEDVARSVAVLGSVMTAKKLGQATKEIERLAVLLDPRYKNGPLAAALFVYQPLNDAAEELKAGYSRFGGGIGAPVVAVGAADGAAVQDNEEPAVAEPVVKKRRLTFLEKQMQAGAVAALGGGRADTEAQLLAAEIETYLAEAVKLPSSEFKLLQYWREKASPKTDVKTGAVLRVPEMPRLAKLAAWVHGVDATSCEAERNFSKLSGLIGDLRSAMGGCKVEQCMFLRLNRHRIKEFAAYDAVVAKRFEERSEAHDKCKEM
jgi:hypothetical protein